MELFIVHFLTYFLIYIVLAKTMSVFKHYFNDDLRLISSSLEMSLSIPLLCHFLLKNNISIDTNSLFTVTKEMSLLLILLFILWILINGIICICKYTKELNDNENLNDENSNDIFKDFFKTLIKRFINVLPSCVILFSSNIIFDYLNKFINIVEKANNSQFIYCILTITICYMPTIIVKTLFGEILNFKKKGEKAE